VPLCVELMMSDCLEMIKLWLSLGLTIALSVWCNMSLDL
jgi:hypothetical protein